MEKIKIAINVAGGVVQCVRSNAADIEVIVIDSDNEPHTAADEWEQLRRELKNTIY